MRQGLVVAGLVLTLGLVGACAKQAPEEQVDPAEQAWSELMDALNELETAEDKTALFEAFLRDHPDTAYAGRLASAVAYYRGHELGDPEGAYEILGETLAKNTDPEARYQIGVAMFPLAMELGEDMDLGAVAAELAETRELDFGELIDVADMAVEHEQWEVGVEYAEAALGKATPEAFLADYPDDDFTAEEAAAKADRRKVMCYSDLGLALWKLGREDEAVAAFEKAMPLRTEDYVGASDTSLDLHSAKVALAGGDPARAMELVAASAIMGSDGDAMDVYRDAFVAAKGSDDGLDEHLWSERQRLARPVDDFTLADYEGVSHDFSALSDGKVTLLAFWFPT